MFEKVLIANRGEIALRIHRACHELGIATVAVHSTADADAMHVRLADESVCIGPPLARDSYLNAHAILSAATITGAEAIHPGYGFLSENADFAAMVEEHGFVFIGPAPEHIRMMGDKIMARRAIAGLGIPVVPGTGGPVSDAGAAQQFADSVGYPVLIKAAGGGGGRGMKVVADPGDLAEGLKLTRAEAASTPSLNAGQRDELGAMACKALAQLGYRNAGTLEFLFEDGRFYFIEMNTRLQVEHPVTEMVCGLDLVREQIRIATGAPIPFRQDQVNFSGHAIECRINAEDPQTFRPSPGRINEYHPPGGLGVRVDSALYSGYRVPPYYDSMVAKLIVHGTTRNECLMRLRRSLDEYVIGGIETTLPLHRRLVRAAEFIDGTYDVHWLEKFVGRAG
ncbi:MAG: acetyl-CoA carboxylase biotin carboxylase subunit [Proteobacteria bacterium]|nr:acetyl-CoA carboxylase biotin carboxylase subunit [Pseudomonadota bacterium]